MMLLLAAQEEEWDDINMMVAALQKTVMRLRYSAKPVVTAPYGLTLGGGCEIAMHGDKVRAAGETYMGQVEVGVGLIPAGCGMGKVATSGQEAKAWGFLKDSDSISMNGDRLIQDAKQEVLNLDAAGYVQPVERTDILASANRHRRR